MRTARAARAVQLSGACVRANKERGYPSVENFWNDLNKLLSDFYKVTVYKGRWVQYLEGLGMTIALAALACLIGVCIGVLVALVKYYAGGKKSFGWKTVNAACGIYVTVIRGTPIVVQLLIAYTILFNGSFEACVFAFGVNSGAYVAEIIRGGIASIDPGQAEAGRSLGLSEGATMRLAARSACRIICASGSDWQRVPMRFQRKATASRRMISTPLLARCSMIPTISRKTRGLAQFRSH